MTTTTPEERARLLALHAAASPLPSSHSRNVGRFPLWLVIPTLSVLFGSVLIFAPLMILDVSGICPRIMQIDTFKDVCLVAFIGFVVSVCVIGCVNTEHKEDGGIPADRIASRRLSGKAMSAAREPIICRNTSYRHECIAYYARKYDGYCLDCSNAGVPELQDRIADLADWKAKAEAAEVQLALVRKDRLVLLDGLSVEKQAREAAEARYTELANAVWGEDQDQDEATHAENVCQAKDQCGYFDGQTQETMIALLRAEDAERQAAEAERQRDESDEVGASALLSLQVTKAEVARLKAELATETDNHKFWAGEFKRRGLILDERNTKILNLTAEREARDAETLRMVDDAFSGMLWNEKRVAKLAALRARLSGTPGAPGE